MTGVERFHVLDPRLQEEVQVGRVHVQIADHMIVCKLCESRGERRLAGAALAADHGDLTHGTPPPLASRERR